MEEDRDLDRLLEIHTRLREITLEWGQNEDWNEDEARSLREEAALSLHKRYVNRVPVYRSLAEEMDVGEDLKDVEVIKTDLMATTDIFKSYDPALLDNEDWPKMTQWLRKVYHDEIPGDFSAVGSLEAWLKKLLEVDIVMLTSSGTTGYYSFVPRDSRSREAQMHNAVTVFQYSPLAKLGDISQYDAALLSFRSASTGVQAASNQIAAAAKNAYFLFDMDMPADAVRILQRGPRNDDERKRIEGFQKALIEEKDIRYETFLDKIRESMKKGQRILMSGACYQLKELCAAAMRQGSVALPEGSCLLFGGGWKSFEDERMDKDELLDLVRSAFDMKDHQVMEGYSMTEMNTVINCCDHGRFHIPPLIEPMVFDEAMMPLPGPGQTGTFGFLDPFALSYPGFLITGDQIDFWHGACPCGTKGYAIDGEIRRAPGQDVKGCGGIMASMKA